MKPTGQMQRRVLYAKTARPGRTGKARGIRRTTGTRKAGRLRQTGTGRPRRTASARLRPFQRTRRSGLSSSASAPSAAAPAIPAIPAAPIRVPIGLPAGMSALCCRRCRHDCRPCRPVCLSSPLTTRPFFGTAATRLPRSPFRGDGRRFLTGTAALHRTWEAASANPAWLLPLFSMPTSNTALDFFFSVHIIKLE